MKPFPPHRSGKNAGDPFVRRAQREIILSRSASFHPRNFTNDAITLITQEEHAQRVLIVDGERFEATIVGQLALLEFQQFVLYPVARRLQLLEQEGRAKLFGAETENRTVLVRDITALRARQSNRHASQCRKIAKWKKLIASGVAKTIDEVSSDDADEEVFLLMTNEGVLPRKPLGAPSGPRRLFVKELDMRSVLNEERKCRENICRTADSAFITLCHIASQEQEAASNRVHRREHLHRLARWRRERDARLKASEKTQAMMVALDALIDAETDTREIVQLSVLAEFRSLHLLQEQEKLNVVVLKFEEAENGARTTIVEEWLSEGLCVIHSVENVARDVVVAMESASSSSLAVKYAELATLQKRWSRVRSSILVVQRWARKIIFGQCGWRRTHRRIGEEIRLKRAHQKARSEKEVRVAALLKLRDDLQCELASLQGAKDLSFDELLRQERADRVKIEQDAAWWLTQRTVAWRHEASAQIVVPLILALERSEEPGERFAIQLEQDDTFAIAIQQFNWISTLFHRQERIRLEESFARSAIGEGMLQEFSSIHELFRREKKSLELAAQRMADRFMLQRKSVESDEESERNAMTVSAVELQWSRFHQFQRLTVFEEYRQSLAEQNFYRAFVDCISNEIASLALETKCTIGNEAMRASAESAWNTFVAAFDFIEFNTTGGRADVMHEEERHFSSIRSQMSADWIVVESIWKSQCAAGRKIVRFYQEYRAGRLGRSGLRRFLHHQFRAKRESNQISAVRSIQTLTVLETKNELAKAVEEHSKSIATTFHYQRISLEKIEVREREDIQSEEAFVRDIIQSNFLLWLQGLLHDELSAIAEAEAYERSRNHLEFFYSYENNFSPEAIQRAFLDTTIQPAQRAWRCYRARAERRRKIQERLHTVTTDEMVRRDQMVNQQIEAFLILCTTFCRSLLWSQWAKEAMSELMHSAVHLATATLYSTYLAGMLDLTAREETRIRLVAIEDCQTTERELMKSEFNRASKQDLQLVLSEIADRKAISTEQSGEAAQTLQLMHSSAADILVAEQQLYRTCIEETASREQLSVEYLSAQGVIITEGENLSRESLIRDREIESCFLSIMGNEIKYRLKAERGLIADLAEVHMAILVDRAIHAFQVMHLEAVFMSERVFLEEQEERADRLSWGLGERTERHLLWSQFIENLEGVHRNFLVNDSEMMSASAQCENDAVRQIWTTSREYKHSLISLSLEHCIQEQLVHTHHFYRLEYKARQEELQYEHFGLQRSRIEEAQRSHRQTIVMEVSTLLDQAMASEERLRRDIAATLIQKQWRRCLLDDQRNEERAAVLLEAYFAMEDAFNEFTAKARALSCVEFLLPRDVFFVEKLEWLKIQELSCISRFAVDVLDDEKAIVFSEEAAARLAISISHFFDPIATVTHVIMKTPPLDAILPSTADDDTDPTDTSDVPEFTLDDSGPFDAPGTVVAHSEAQRRDRVPHYLLHSPVFDESVQVMFASILLPHLLQLETSKRSLVCNSEGDERGDVLSMAEAGLLCRKLEHSENLERVAISRDWRDGFRLITEIAPSSEAARDDILMNEDLGRLDIDDQEETTFRRIMNDLQRSLVAERQRIVAQQEVGTLIIQNRIRQLWAIVAVEHAREKHALFTWEHGQREGITRSEGSERIHLEKDQDAAAAAIHKWLENQSTERSTLSAGEQSHRHHVERDESEAFNAVHHHATLSFLAAKAAEDARKLTPAQAALKLTSWARMVLQLREYRLAQRINRHQTEMRVKKELMDYPSVEE